MIVNLQLVNDAITANMEEMHKAMLGFYYGRQSDIGSNKIWMMDCQKKQIELEKERNQLLVELLK